MRAVKLYGVSAIVVCASPRLEQREIKSLYMSGKVDSAAVLIETFQSVNPVFGREDSVFISKFLSVIYAAQPEKTGIARDYMRRLLTLDPKAEIGDMFASDEVDTLFQRTKRALALANGRKPEAGEETGGSSDFDSLQVHAADKGGRIHEPREGGKERADRKSQSPRPGQALETDSAGKGARTLWVVSGLAVLTLAGTATWFFLNDTPDAEPREITFNSQDR
jgi:hypothetical protein